MKRRVEMKGWRWWCQAVLTVTRFWVWHAGTRYTWLWSVLWACIWISRFDEWWFLLIFWPRVEIRMHVSSHSHIQRSIDICCIIIGFSLSKLLFLPPHIHVFLRFFFFSLCLFYVIYTPLLHSLYKFLLFNHLLCSSLFLTSTLFNLHSIHLCIFYIWNVKRKN